MKKSWTTLLPIALALTVAALWVGNSWGATGIFADAECPIVGGVEAVCGIGKPEDLVLFDRDWVIASGMTAPSRIAAINIKSRKVFTLVDGRTESSWDRSRFPSCPGPLPPGAFSSHGISVGPVAENKRTLFVVNHGGRESVEVYELTMDQTPVARWIGCIEMPAGAMGNAVAPLADGRLVATNFGSPTPDLMDRIFRGEITGGLLVWGREDGWHPLSPTRLSGANGVEVSGDGRYIVAAASGSRSLLRIDRKTGTEQVIRLSFIPDNVRSDGRRMLVSGYTGKVDDMKACLAKPKCRVDSVVIAIDPKTLQKSTLLTQNGASGAGSFSTGLVVGQDLWLGSIAGDRVGIVKNYRQRH